MLAVIEGESDRSIPSPLATFASHIMTLAIHVNTVNFRLKAECKKYKALAIAALLALTLFVVSLYALIPLAVKHHLNTQVLASMGAYTGHVEAVKLRLATLSYEIEELRVEQKKGDANYPFFATHSLVIGINVQSALRGHIDVDAHLKSPELNFIDSPIDAKQQTGKGTNWLTIFRKILPTSVNTLTVHKGTIRLINLDSDPKVSLIARDIGLSLQNLSQALESHDKRSASGAFHAHIEDSSQIFASAQFDPEHFDDFHLKAIAKDIQLIEFNDFFEAYAKMDFDSGFGDILMEFSAKQGELKGYAKPFLHDIQIISWSQDITEQHDNPLKLLWELSLEVVQNIITTLGTDELATKITFNGDLSRAKVQTWPAFVEAIKNMLLNSVKKSFDPTNND